MNISTPLKAGLIVLSSTIGSIVAADLVMRSIGYLPQVGKEWILGQKGDSRVPDDKLILVPPQFLDEYFYAVDPAQETIVILGDSYVAGHPVDSADSFPSVLGRLLRERSRPVNILNMGIGDSGPDQHLRLMKEFVLPQLTPDVVIWTFFANDVVDNVRLGVYDLENGSLQPLNAAEHWLYIRHKFYRSIPLPISVKESSPVLRLLFRAQENWAKRKMQFVEPPEIARSLEKIRLAIEELERLSSIHGFQTMYVLIAPQALYLAEQDPVAWSKDFLITEYDQLRPIIARQGLFVDAWFNNTDAHACGSQIEVPDWSTLYSNEERDHNRMGARHFNEAGYYLLADFVAACLFGAAG